MYLIIIGEFPYFPEYHDILVRSGNVHLYVNHLHISCLYAVLFCLVSNVECGISGWHCLWSIVVSAITQRAINRQIDFATCTKTVRSERIWCIRLLVGSLYKGDAYDRMKYQEIASFWVILMIFVQFFRWFEVLCRIIWFFVNYAAAYKPVHEYVSPEEHIRAGRIKIRTFIVAPTHFYGIVCQRELELHWNSLFLLSTPHSCRKRLKGYQYGSVPKRPWADVLYFLENRSSD